MGTAAGDQTDGVIIESVDQAIGHTPLLHLTRLFAETAARRHLDLYAKLEQLNPGGSAKDRPAVGMLADALASGRLRPGGTVVESSSGNLGVALARACTLAGVRFVCVVDVNANPTTVAHIRALGGQISLVSEPDPVTGLLGARHQRVRDLLTADPGAVNLNQYGNPANPAAHRTGTAAELLDDLDGDVDAILVACSTTGTINGFHQTLDDRGLDQTRLVAVDAVGSVLFGGQAGHRVLPGMGAGLVTDLSRQLEPDEVVRVDDGQAVAGCRVLARQEGVLAGGSAGAVVWALGTMLDRLPEGSRVAVVLHDGGVPYLQTVYDDQWVAESLGCNADQLARLEAGLSR